MSYKIKLTEEQIEAVVAEIQRRHEIDVADAYQHNYELPAELLLEKKQGMYGTLMAISENWAQVAKWIEKYTEKYGI